MRLAASSIAHGVLQLCYVDALTGAVNLSRPTREALHAPATKHTLQLLRHALAVGERLAPEDALRQSHVMEELIAVARGGGRDAAAEQQAKDAQAASSAMGGGGADSVTGGTKEDSASGAAAAAAAPVAALRRNSLGVALVARSMEGGGGCGGDPGGGGPASSFFGATSTTASSGSEGIYTGGVAAKLLRYGYSLHAIEDLQSGTAAARRRSRASRSSRASRNSRDSRDGTLRAPSRGRSPSASDGSAARVITAGSAGSGGGGTGGGLNGGESIQRALTADGGGQRLSLAQQNDAQPQPPSTPLAVAGAHYESGSCESDDARPLRVIDEVRHWQHVCGGVGRVCRCE